MSPLGEILIRLGVIDKVQLTEGLDRQRQRAGRLGTQLVQLSIASLDDISRALAVQHALPEATAPHLEAANEAALHLLSTEVCDRLFLLPFAKDDNELHVAMRDPSGDLPSELHALELSIRPYVAPELRIQHYLHAHLGIEVGVELSMECEGETDQTRPLSLECAEPSTTTTTARATPDDATGEGQDEAMVFGPPSLTEFDLEHDAGVTLPPIATQLPDRNSAPLGEDPLDPISTSEQDLVDLDFRMTASEGKQGSGIVPTPQDADDERSREAEAASLGIPIAPPLEELSIPVAPPLEELSIPIATPVRSTPDVSANPIVPEPPPVDFADAPESDESLDLDLSGPVLATADPNALVSAYGDGASGLDAEIDLEANAEAGPIGQTAPVGEHEVELSSTNDDGLELASVKHEIPTDGYGDGGAALDVDLGGEDETEAENIDVDIDVDEPS